jgi:hypothetical protein
VALVRNFLTGTVIAISGYLIKWTGSYVLAFWFGFSLSSVAIVIFFIYRRIMRSGGNSMAISNDQESGAGLIGESVSTA